MAPADGATQRDVADYVVTLWGAWSDCRTTVEKTAEFWRRAQKDAQP